MKRLAWAGALALLMATALYAQSEITITVSADRMEVARKLVARQLHVEPATVTDAMVKTAITQTCRDAFLRELRVFKELEDYDALQVMKNDLTEAQRAQVRALILSFQ